MRQSNYLNAILTVNAGLLAVLVWTQIAERPVLIQDAVAQSSPSIALDAGAQRQRLVDAVKSLERSMDVSMKDLVRSVELTRAVLKNGQTQVRVINSAELAGRDVEKKRSTRKLLSGG